MLTQNTSDFVHLFVLKSASVPLCWLNYDHTSLTHFSRNYRASESEKAIKIHFSIKIDAFPITQNNTFKKKKQDLSKDYRCASILMKSCIRVEQQVNYT